MALTFYESYVPNYLQTLQGVSNFMDRGLSHFTDNNIDPSDIVETRLFPDMLPFRFQILSVVHHSATALASLKDGIFKPPGQSPPHSYADLQKIVADARERIAAIKADDVNAFEGKDMAFQIGEMKMPFTAEGFIASFSLPNFYFHATTAYDILRTKGVPLGKRDFMGTPRMKH